MQGELANNQKLGRLLEVSKLNISAGKDLMEAYNATHEGKLDEAARIYASFEQKQKRLLELAENPTDQKSTASTFVNALFMYADVLHSLGKREEAGRKRNKALQLSRKFMGAAGNAEGERSRAASLISEARFNEALTALYTARGYFEESGDVIRIARTSIDLADLLQWLGDYDRAEEAVDFAAWMIKDAAFRERLDGLVDLVEKQRIETEISYNRGLIAKFTGHYDKAQQYFNEVLPKYEAIGVGPAIQYQIAAVSLQTGDPDKTLKIIDEIEPKFRIPGMFRPKLAGLLKLRAEALIKLGRFEEAITYLEEGLKDLKNYYDPDLQWRLEWLYGSALKQANRQNESIRVYGEAIDTVAMLRRAPLGYRLDSLYLLDKIDLFSDAIAAAAEFGMARDCARFMEVIKTRTLSAILSLPHSETDDANDKLVKRFKYLSQRLDAIEYQGFRNSWTRELREEQKKLLAERADVIEQLRFSDPRWHTLTEPVSFDINKLLSDIKGRNHAVLTLFVTDGNLHAVLLGSDKELTASQSFSDELRSALQEYGQNLLENKPNPLLFDLSKRLSINAGDIVPKSLLSVAINYESLVIVPHGELNLLPWAGLLYEGKRLFEYCSVGVLPNLTSLLSLSDDPSDKPSVALLGPPEYQEMQALIPLDSALHEVKEIETIYKTMGGVINRPFTGSDATEDNFWHLASLARDKPTVLHVSCHGGIEPLEPMNSGLYMSDGKVDAAEISHSRLPYPEVVMSACSTGWSPTVVDEVKIVGDDVLGLPCAFIEAGAQSVLVSIPMAVEAAATDLMILYHINRSDGKSPLHAYRESQLAMLKGGKHIPALWIGFVMYGCR